MSLQHWAETEVEESKGSFAIKDGNVHTLCKDQTGKDIRLINENDYYLETFVIAFIKGWLLALVMPSSVPLLVLATGAMSLFLSKMATPARALSQKFHDSF